MTILLNNHDIHLWSVPLIIDISYEQTHYLTLSNLEQERCKRLKLRQHQQRFITAHSALRYILSLYLKLLPKEISFSYNSYDKPALISSLPIQFNMAHSHDFAVIALTSHYAIGVDIEKIRATYSSAVAERYFSKEENKKLKTLNTAQQVLYFFRLWSCKEALVKAVGKGLTVPLHSFSTKPECSTQQVNLEGEEWTLCPFSIDPQYTSAFATNQPVKAISYRQLILNEGNWSEK